MAASRKTFKNLTTADKFYIEKQFGLLSIEQIAKDIGATPQAVRKFHETMPGPIEPCPSAAVTSPPPPAPEPDIKPEHSMTGTAVSAQTPIVREDGVTVTTPASSQWADEAMKRQPGNYIDANKDRIFRPRPNKPSR